MSLGVSIPTLYRWAPATVLDFDIDMNATTITI
ncbi:hypothetical protein THIX_50032 [Thiomonas sp. X19]|nr:hypothetical protein THIX_50032 [Thiomonas sp. X19]